MTSNSLLGRRVALFAVAVLLAAGLVACEKSGAPQFSHKPHLANGMACADCHQSGGARPTVDTCKGCHSEAMERVTPAQVEAIMAAKPAGPGAYGLTFDHARHSGLECADCHKSGEEIRNPSMDYCMNACHGEGKDVALSCDKCHATLDAAGRPSDHASGWEAIHGRKAISNQRECLTCHEQQDCFSCHRTAKPQDHTNAWRLRGHGVVVSADRNRCMACHTQEFCTRCHLKTRPISHTPSWTGVVDNHCRNCHVPLTNNGNNTCATCHFEGAPHSSAPAWRTDMTHVSGASCRNCHVGPGQKLEHPDNGDNCEVCHAK